MNKEKAIRFAGLMEDYLNIPSFVCEMIQQQLEENKYKEVVEYVVQRRNEIESKPEFISDRNAITMLVNQNEEKDKEIERLNNIIKQKDNIINELEKYLKEQIDEHYSWHYREWIRQVLNKLKELKEGE